MVLYVDVSEHSAQCAVRGNVVLYRFCILFVACVYVYLISRWMVFGAVRFRF